MNTFERAKAKSVPRRVDLSHRPAGDSSEQTKPEPVNSTMDKESPAPKSANSDADRKKFFQSLLQNKNGPKGETAVPKTIPEESESDQPNSPLQEERARESDTKSPEQGGEKASKSDTNAPAEDRGSASESDTNVPAEGRESASESDTNAPAQGGENTSESEFKPPVPEGKKASNSNASNAAEMNTTQGVTSSECNEDEKLETSEERPSNVEGSFSATGVSSEVRGAEVADQAAAQGSDSPDKEPNAEGVAEGHAEKSKVTENIVIENINNETDATENVTTLSSTEESKLTESNEEDKRDKVIDESRTEPSSTEVSPSNEGEKLEKSEDRTASDSAQPELLTETNTNSKVGQDLLDDKEKAKDVDSSLTIAVKSSYIGAASEMGEVTEMRSDNKEVRDSKENVVSPERVIKSEEQNVAEAKENSVQNASVESSSGMKPSQPGSPSTSVGTGAESSPTSTPSATPAATSNAGSPGQKSTYRAHVNIPEFLWSPIHQRLLGDLLFSIESDVQVWRR